MLLNNGDMFDLDNSLLYTLLFTYKLVHKLQFNIFYEL